MSPRLDKKPGMGTATIVTLILVLSVLAAITPVAVTLATRVGVQPVATLSP